MKANSSVEKYILSFPVEVQETLLKIRQMIFAAAPNATESISYGMPCFWIYKHPLIYFAAFKNHIGVYALPSTHEAFKNELSGYKHGKGSVQFPIKEPIPFALIEKMISFRVKENKEKYDR